MLQAQAGWSHHDYGHQSVFNQLRVNNLMHQIVICFIKVSASPLVNFKKIQMDDKIGKEGGGCKLSVETTIFYFKIWYSLKKRCIAFSVAFCTFCCFYWEIRIIAKALPMLAPNVLLSYFSGGGKWLVEAHALSAPRQTQHCKCNSHSGEWYW